MELQQWADSLHDPLRSAVAEYLAFEQALPSNGTQDHELADALARGWFGGLGDGEAMQARYFTGLAIAKLHRCRDAYVRNQCSLATLAGGGVVASKLGTGMLQAAGHPQDDQVLRALLGLGKASQSYIETSNPEAAFCMSDCMRVLQFMGVAHHAESGIRAFVGRTKGTARAAADAVRESESPDDRSIVDYWQARHKTGISKRKADIETAEHFGLGISPEAGRKKVERTRKKLLD